MKRRGRYGGESNQSGEKKKCVRACLLMSGLGARMLEGV